MRAHGADPDKLDEAQFREICVMYADGLIGNNLIVETLGNLTAGVYNYMRSSNSQPYKLKSIIGKAYEYIYPPQQYTTESASQSLLLFMTQAQGFSNKLFEAGNERTS